MAANLPLGNELRKIRQDAGLLLGDLADRLNVSASFLSQVENGKKRIPDGFIGRLTGALNLSPQQQRNLERAAAHSAKTFEIRLGNEASVNDRQLAHVLSAHFARLTPASKKKIMEIVTGEHDD